MNNVSPDTVLSGLNEDQCKAVTVQINGSVLILAGAGCGKTTVLIRRIEWLCANGIPPEKICALTFTQKAAEEMRQRFGKKSNTYIQKPCVATFHSFALSILNDCISKNINFSKIGYTKQPMLQSDHERLRLLFELTSKDERGLLGVDIAGLDSLISKYRVFPERIRMLDQERITCIEQICRRINLKKVTLGLWDFDDLIPMVLTLFKTHYNVCDHYRKKFEYFLVDEFQDTNPIQIQLLKTLLLKKTGLFAVGDDDQAIYGFRGADIRPMLEFCLIFPHAQRLKLQVNYRSVPSILIAANKIFKDKPEEYRKILKSGLYIKNNGQKPVKCCFENQSEMMDWILKKTTDFSKKNRIRISDCVLLFRLNKTRKWAAEYIKSKGVSKLEEPKLMTIHASKGLEFPIVFLCDLEESVFPNYRITHLRHHNRFFEFIMNFFGYRRHQIECDWEEERRLFYVGVTRAMTALYLITVKNKQIFGRTLKFEKSRFLRLI